MQDLSLICNDCGKHKEAKEFNPDLHLICMDCFSKRIKGGTRWSTQ